jgi:RNA polymerase sigma factor (sigma-70 family)
VLDSEVPQAERSARAGDLLSRAREAAPKEAQRMRDEVVVLHLDVAAAIALRYRNRGVSDEDLVQTGFVGLIKAARDYDPAKSDCFLTYAVPKIRGEVKRLFRDSAWLVRPPRRVQGVQVEVADATARLSQANGSTPTVSELAEHLGLSCDDVLEAMAVNGCFSGRPLDVAGDEWEGRAPVFLAQEEHGFERCEALVTLRPLCERLTIRDRRLLYLRFFCGWTQARIAAECGMTQIQVSRTLSRILAEMRRQLGCVDVDGEPRRAARSADGEGGAHPVGGVTRFRAPHPQRLSGASADGQHRVLAG